MKFPLENTKFAYEAALKMTGQAAYQDGNKPNESNRTNRTNGTRSLD